jgi:uncharacterized protein YbjT (DUF2867 family)
MGKNTIVVCGATGQQGGAVINALAQGDQWNITALSRDPDSPGSKSLKEKGIRVVKADLQDKVSLVNAFQNADMVFGVTQPFSSDYRKSNPTGEIGQGYNIVDSCLETGVKRLVLSTVFSINSQNTGVAHVDSKTVITEYLKKSGVNYTILKPASLMDNIGKSYFPVKSGKVRGFADKDAKIPYISTKDIGEFAALVFNQPDLYNNSEINLMADLVSGGELAGTLSRIRAGEPFRYSAAPRLLMWLFAREFYEMRISFEKSGRPPYPEEYSNALQKCREMLPGILNMEMYLMSRGYDVKQL